MKKLLNFIILALMVLSQVAQHYNWPDGVDATEAIKWVIEFITLLL